MRGLFVLAVLAYHGGLLGGGYLGVDGFFVLSGFLITALLMEERGRTGTISFRRFYARRALRLLPALVVMLGVCIVVVPALAWLDGVRGVWPQVARPMIGMALVVLLYAANWAAIVGMPLYVFSHTWSLAIEEQFYVVWPLALWLLLRGLRARGAVLAVVLGGIGVSVSTRVWLHESGAGAARLFAGLDTRADALLAGCALALLISWKGLPGGRRAQRWASATASLGAFLLVTLAIGARWQAPWMMRGGATVAALAVAAVILHVLMQPSGRAAGTLGTGVLAAMGRISYGLYLWHFPIFWVTGALRTDGGTVDLPRALLASAVSFAVAALCYRTIERPALRLKARLAPP